MRLVHGQLLLAPTDLGTFISCRHRSGLDLAVAHGARHRPATEDPYAAILRRKGEEHEQRYVDTLRRRGLGVTVIDRSDGSVASLTRQTDDTVAAMQGGAEVIVQARLAHGNLAGYADVLVRVPHRSRLGGWSYEPQDTKLARDTRGSAILQLCGYSELLEHMQGVLPTQFHVVTPDPVHPVQTYRTADFFAYYRTVRGSLEAVLTLGHDLLCDSSYPEPVEHCAVCAWERHCEARRRRDDHLSFIANAGRAQRQELAANGFPSLTAAATMPVPVPFTPARGGRETYDRLGHQARVQHQQRTERRPIVERLPIVDGDGLTRLPAPSAGDVFVDLEGARFAREGGREFLFGVWTAGTYCAHWSLTDAEEKHAFERVMDLIMAAWKADSAMHVYHFNHYEPTAFKKLVGRHATRAEALDQLLRAERFVDLYPVVRQAVRCGVESYSIKQLEQYYAFERRVSLRSIAPPLVAVELALEARAPESISEEIREAVEGYNRDDCRSAEGLRNWLESVRSDAITAGQDVARPRTEEGSPSPEVAALQAEVNELRARLLATLPTEASAAGHPDHARWLLAYLIDWHRREENADWWDFFRLVELPDDALLDEGRVITGLKLVEELEVVTNRKTGRPTGSVVRRFRYPAQETEIGRSGTVVLPSAEYYGTVEGHDRAARTIDLKSTSSALPCAVVAKDVVKQETPQRSVMRLAARVLEGSDDECGLDLLYRRPPRLTSGHFAVVPGEEPSRAAQRFVNALSRTTLPVQGPPGAGKTFTGARMILEAIAAGKRVGVTATGHKVIVNLLDAVLERAREEGVNVVVGRKPGDAEDPADGPVRLYRENGAALEAISDGEVQVLGGTAWLWARQEFENAVDVLFVDEAGQMSLANALAVSHAARSLVLLGDPRQLDQPQKAAHPDGVGISALEHVLGGAETMPPARGIFLPTTYRMAPAITRFTSELFYEGKLEAKPALVRQELAGTGRFDGAGLWLVNVDHDGNQNSSAEEVEAVAELVGSLLNPEWTLTAPVPGQRQKPQGPRWIDEHGVASPLTGADIKVVAPFNAQVNRLSERLAPLGIAAGTVDKFQGQEAAIVIYSMTTSRPEDAPRGMEFLYSLNRLNVATSRARCAVFLVCSPRLLAPECRTPRQMQLANALCRYRELASRSLKKPAT